ncbi:hypothetical protein L0244_21560, partial [bacterium]|nr:hypothetical protein [bacterium]
TNSSESLSIKQLIDSEDKEETVSVSQKFCAKIDHLQQASPLLLQNFRFTLIAIFPFPALARWMQLPFSRERESR